MKLLCFLVLLIQGLPDGNPAETIVYYTDNGQAEFTSRVPLHTFTGRSDHLTGMIDLEESVVDFYLDLNTLRTGIDRRDRDMFRTLEVDEHPFAEFNGSLESSFDNDSTDRQTVTAVGEFTLHGVTNAVRIEGYLINEGDDIRLEAEWTLLLNDYDIEPPGILFYRVDEELQVRIEAHLKPAPEDEL